MNNEFKCDICNKEYRSRGWYDNHLRNVHNQGSNNLIPEIELPSQSSQNQLQNQSNNSGWNKDQIELALELSMKEQFKDYIPDEDDILEMSSAKACSICLSKKADIAFINCGHMISCEECATKLRYGKCPICRKKILKILKIYS